MQLVKWIRSGFALCLAMFASASFAGASAPPPFPGTYYFSGTCLDCTQPLGSPSPVTATLVIGNSYATSSFEYQSALLGLLQSVSVNFISLGSAPITNGPETVNVSFQVAANAGFFFGSSTDGSWSVPLNDEGINGVWSLTPIPEPQTLALWMLGLTAVGAVARRRAVRRVL